MEPISTPVPTRGTLEKWEENLVKFLRLLGALCGAAVIIAASFSFIALGFLNPRGVIADVYLVIFGLIMIIAELRWVTLLRYCYFLQHYAGLGLFYIFVGGLVLGEVWWLVLVAVFLLSVGIIYLLLGCCCRRMNIKPLHPPDAAGGMAGYSQQQYASDDPRWEQSSNSGPAYGYNPNPEAGTGFTPSPYATPAYGGYTAPPAVAAQPGGGAGGWGLNVTPQNALSAVRTAQSMGLTADHVVQGAQAASKIQSAYGP